MEKKLIVPIIVALVAFMVATVAFISGNMYAGLFSAEGLTGLAWICVGAFMLCALSMAIYGILDDGSLLSGVRSAIGVVMGGFIVAKLCEGAAWLNPDFIQREIFIYPAYYLPCIASFILGFMIFGSLDRDMKRADLLRKASWGTLYISFGIILGCALKFFPTFAQEIAAPVGILSLIVLVGTWYWSYLEEEIEGERV